MITPKIAELFIEKHFDVINQQDDEWQLPSFENPDKDKLYFNVEKMVGIDFIGGKSYSFNSLVAKKLNLSKEETEQYINDFVLNNIQHIDFNQIVQPKKVKPVPKPVQMIPLPDNCLDMTKDTALVKRIKNYLYNRNLDDDDIGKYHLTFCYKGDMKNRIIIPFIENNQIIWYQGRAIYQNMLRYDNPKGIEKSMIVYNIDEIKDQAILVEGPFDAMMCNGQAIMGSTLSDWQTMKIIAKKPERIIIAPDNDWIDKLKMSPGYNGALASIDKLVKAGYNINNIYVAFQEQGKDFNSIGKERTKSILDKAERFTLSTLIKFMKFNATNEYLKRIL